MVTEQSGSVIETKELCISIAIRACTLTLSCLFISPQEDGMVPVLLQFHLDGMVSCSESVPVFQDLCLATVIYFSTGSLDSFTKNYPQIQTVCGSNLPIDLSDRVIYCLDEVFPDKLSSRA